MLQRLSALILSTVLYLGVTPASATVTLSVPNYPTVAQLETGWNNAFIAILTAAHGMAPTITGTTTYQGAGGAIYVVSTFTVGSTTGSILGTAFNPATATSLGNGNYSYAANKGFRCERSDGFCSCTARQAIKPDVIIQECVCDGGSGGCALINIDGQFTGTYDLNPANYSSLPTMN